MIVALKLNYIYLIKAKLKTNKDLIEKELDISSDFCTIDFDCSFGISNCNQ